MGKIYTKQGWVNWSWIMEDPAVFIMMVGPRGVGKTYGIFDYCIDNRIPFIYLRRLKTQLDLCGKPSGNPFRKISIDKRINIVPFKSDGVISFRHDCRTGEEIACGVALSTVATVRGVDFSGYDVIVFDESIPMAGEKPIKDEFQTFLNFYETVNRNRELSGDKPVKCILLGNANKLSNPYFTGWKFTKTALRMLRGKQMVYRTPDGSRMMVLLQDSPVSEKKSRTALYQNATEDFITMALDNAFMTDETNIRSEPLKEYIHIVSVGEIGIYKHKSDRKYYVSAKTSTPYYADFGIQLKMFQQVYFMLRVYYMEKKNIIFEDFESELLFRDYFDLI